MENQNKKSENNGSEKNNPSPKGFNPLWGLMAMGVLVTIILLAEVLWIKK